MKKLSQEPFIHDGCEIVESTFGAYTEMGAFNVIENSHIGDYAYTGPNCFVQNTQVGKFANIAAHVRIGPTDHPMERPTQHHFTYRRKMYGFDEVDDVSFFEARKQRVTTIGHDAWIGHGAIIMPGVTIGNGAVVGAGSIVTKDVAPFEIVVGVPAKKVRNRFSDEVIQKLQEIGWWHWSHQKIKDNFGDFLQDTEAFVDKHWEG
ncbi:MAG: chloramphenicol acetyltransferase [Turicibacter sp.]|nr:chloramphenicol acetyltransferase [Turicibacter sp.]